MKQSPKYRILITGSAGFIGYHIANQLLKENHFCIGIDNLNDYYDKNLKISRTKILKKNKNFKFLKIDLSKKKQLNVLSKFNFDLVINLAAQAGVRYAFKNPDSYIKSNVVGFTNLMNFIKNNKIKKLIFASTSSVYGDIKSFPWSENNNINSPLTIYSSSKIFNENLSYSYSKYYNIQCLGLRFFTVYGEFGRPDMSIYNFTKKILENKPITIYNNGNHMRDFTHVDIIKDIFSQLITKEKIKLVFKNSNFEILNIAGGNKVKLLDLVSLIEKFCKKKAKKIFLGMQIGDIKKTQADIKKLKKFKLIKKNVKIEDGVKRFVNWYKKYDS
jgi:UDP-glucuronate 4-epimerase